MTEQQLCIFCRYCSFELSEPYYSEYTPGIPPRIECYLHRIEFTDKLREEFIVSIKKAETCPDYILSEEILK